MTITTLIGHNSYLIKLKAHQIIDDFTKENGDLAVQKIDCEEATSDQISEAIQSLPFFNPCKLVVLTNPSRNKEVSQSIDKLLSDIPDSTELLIVENYPDKRSTIYKILKSKTDMHEYNPQDESTMSSWIIDYAKSKGGSISAKDSNYLVSRVGTDQQRLANEIDKLVTFDKNISIQSIDLLTQKSINSTIFELIEAAMKGNVDKALKLYDEQRFQNVQPVQIIAMLTWQLHILLLVKSAAGKTSGQIASEAKISPFVVGKTQAIAHLMDINKIKQLISELLDIDRRSKTVSVDVDQALKLYIASINSA